MNDQLHNSLTNKKLTWIQYIQNEIGLFWKSTRFQRYYYQLLLLISGLFLLKILAKDGFPVRKTFLVMLGWLLLVILFPTPEKAKSNIQVFTD